MKIPRPMRLRRSCEGASQPSLVFLILAGIVVVMFGAALFHLMSLPSFEEERAQQTEQLLLQSYENAAKAAGVTAQEYKEQLDRDAEIRRQQMLRLKALQAAIEAHDDNVVSEIFNADLVAAQSKNMNDLFSLAIKSNNPSAFDRLLSSRLLECDNTTPGGHRAFSAATSSEQDSWLEKLITAGCSTEGNKYYRDVRQQVIKSQYRYRLVELPGGSADEFQAYFFKDLKRLTGATATRYLDGGVSVNATDTSGRSALMKSIKDNPEVAQLLLDRGADVRHAAKKGSVSALVWALRSGRLKIAQAIVSKDPQHIADLGLESQAIGALFGDENKSQLSAATDLVLSDDINFDDLANKGSHWLIRAVETRKPELLVRLLDAGADPNQVYQFRTPLSVARQRHVNNDSLSNQMVSALLAANASDDILALVRKANGKSQDTACTLGRKVEYVVSARAIEMLANQSNGTRKRSRVASQEDSCAMAAGDCVNQGHGMDDCLHSIGECSADGESSFCCSEELKGYYFEARCAGMSVYESIDWMERSSRN